MAAALLAALLPAASHAQTFATTVASSSGLGTNSTYNNPAAALGQPGTLVNGIYDNPKGVYHASMVYPPYNKDPQGNNLLVTTGTGGQVTVKFDAPIVHDANHWFGDDFLVFGNTFFSGKSAVTPTTDMSTEIISSGNYYQNGTPSISVSADGVTFYTFTANPVWYPTNPYKWVGISSSNPSGWDDTAGNLNDFTKPVNAPQSLFAGQSVASADANLYNGSAGGAAFSLAGLTDSVGNPINSIQYIRFTGTGGSSAIDAVSRVGFAPAAAPEPAPWAVCAFGAGGIAILLRRKQISKQHLV